jgi:hypothetical protein
MKLVKCPQCNGKGEYETIVNNTQYPVKCTVCNGSGKVEKVRAYSKTKNQLRKEVNNLWLNMEFSDNEAVDFFSMFNKDLIQELNNNGLKKFIKFLEKINNTRKDNI